MTTGVISGNGYETITFEKYSHLKKYKGHICLKIKDDYKHISGESKFIDSNTGMWFFILVKLVQHLLFGVLTSQW